MVKDDVLFGYRLQLFAEAQRTSVSAACRVFGVHRSTYYVWKRRVDRHGLEMLRPRERRRPQMPNQLSQMVEERVLSFSIAHPGLGPKRVSSELAREKWGGIIVSPNGVWRVLCRHGLNTRAKRHGLVAGYAAPYEPPRDPGPDQHIEVDVPGELVGIDCFYVGQLRGTRGAIWQLTAIDIRSSFAWAELIVAKDRNPTARQTSTFARRVAAELKSRRLAPRAAAQRQRQRIQRRLHDHREAPRGSSHAHPRRPPADQRQRRSAPQDHPRRMLATSLRALPLPKPQRPTTRAPRLPRLLQPRPHTPRPPDPRPHPRRHHLRCPQNGGQMSRTCRHISESAHLRSCYQAPHDAPRTYPGATGPVAGCDGGHALSVSAGTLPKLGRV
jgi:transposase